MNLFKSHLVQPDFPYIKCGFIKSFRLCGNMAPKRLWIWSERSEFEF